MITLDEFKSRFRILKAKGFVQSRRAKATGVGYTLESEIGIQENNISLPDIGEAELKAHREGSTNSLTLFTFNRRVWKINPLDAIRQYGSRDRDGRLGLYYTLSTTPNAAGLYTRIDETRGEIIVLHTSGERIAVWQIADLSKRFLQKLPALIVVTARVERRDGVEWFHYYRAQLLQDTNAETLLEQFKSGRIVLDLRLHDAGTRARNHGTGFRVGEQHLIHLFRRISDL